MDIPVGEIVAWAWRKKVSLAIVAGIAFRLVGYLSGRGFWMDEGSLASNIRGLPPIGFFGPLLNHQLAPPGFLVACWAAIQIFGDNLYAIRLVPMAGGIASLFLFVAVAGRCLPPMAVLPAALMFAVANDPVYFASELKQYSTDLAFGLAIVLAGLTVGSRPLTATGTAPLAIGGATVVWFSHPSIFTLASVGMVGMARALGSRDWRRGGLWMIVGGAWLASFAGVHAVANRQLGGSDQMWRFWGFAFPPIPPESFWDATWFARRLMYYFINPLNFDAPFGVRLSLLPALGLAIIGAWKLWTLDRARFALLTLPIVLTMLASSLRLYPFHGRLVLFLVPAPLIAIAAGLDTVRQARGRGFVYYTLATMVLIVPTASACKEAVEPWTTHNGFGDLHPHGVDPYKFPF